jgi:hypothetical protein
MKRSLLIVAALICALPAQAADKRVFRVDSLIATQKGSHIIIEAKGAVQGGGWTKPRLHVIHSDGHVMTLDFLATPPPPEMTVIAGLVPLAASLQLKGHAASVHVLADENEIATQVLR